jgi:Cu/Ag efflux protein CusF
MKTLFAAAIALLICLPSTSRAQDTASLPTFSATLEDTLVLHITRIEKEARLVTLKNAAGDTLSVECGPEVKNFDKLKVGDKVDLQYLEALTLELKKGGGMIVARTEQAGAASAKPGEKPAAGAGRQVTIVADVVALDPAKQIVTLKGPQRTVDLRIPDPEQFKRIAKGDQVEAKYTQAVALTVEAAK